MPRRMHVTHNGLWAIVLTNQCDRVGKQYAVPICGVQWKLFPSLVYGLYVGDGHNKERDRQQIGINEDDV